MVIQTGSSPMTINTLGRFAAPGNTGTHLVKIVDATTATDLPGGSVSVSMAGAATGSFAYASLSTPVNLNPNATYYIVTQETADGNQWYEPTRHSKPIRLPPLRVLCILARMAT